MSTTSPTRSAASSETSPDEAASLLQRLFAPDLAGGTLLISAPAVALEWANSGASDWYDAVWRARYTIGFEAFQLFKPLILWVNDLLMAIFFLLVGLEIKAESLTGELNSLRRAAIPAIAALACGEGNSLAEQAKIAILIASLVCGTVWMLTFAARQSLTGAIARCSNAYEIRRGSRV